MGYGCVKIKTVQIFRKACSLHVALIIEKLFLHSIPWNGDRKTCESCSTFHLTNFTSLSSDPATSGLHIFSWVFGYLTFSLLKFAGSELRSSLSLVSSPHLRFVLAVCSALVPDLAPAVPTGAKAHGTEAKQIPEHFCIVAQKVKSQNYSKRPWLLTFYSNGRILPFVQCYIRSSQSTPLCWNFNIYFKISIIWKTIRYPNIFFLQD